MCFFFFFFFFAGGGGGGGVAAEERGHHRIHLYKIKFCYYRHFQAKGSLVNNI